MRKALSLLCLLLLYSNQSFGWGFKGHRIVADIAEARLTPAAKAQIKELLDGQSLADVSGWADEIRRERPETTNWHFVDIPRDTHEGVVRYDAARDCKPSPHGDCVVAEIERTEAVLADKTRSKAERAEALKFLVHFVGDIHQPFHGIATARGGNDIHVVEFGSPQCGTRPCNLHGAWDSGLIDHAGLSEKEYVAQLEKLIPDKHIDAYEMSPEKWADESQMLAMSAMVPEGGKVDQAYYENFSEMVNIRLAQAGVRLAAALNQALDPPKR